jgi:hypothetical protein
MENCAGFSLHSGSWRLKGYNPFTGSRAAGAHLSINRRTLGGFPYLPDFSINTW